MVASKDKRDVETSRLRLHFYHPREALNLSANDMGEMLDIDPYYYYAIENGRRGHNLGVRLFYEICKCLNLDVIETIEKEVKYQKDRYKDENDE